jgi:hypothetical protein
MERAGTVIRKPGHSLVPRVLGGLLGKGPAAAPVREALRLKPGLERNDLLFRPQLKRRQLRRFRDREGPTKDGQETYRRTDASVLDP